MDGTSEGPTEDHAFLEALPKEVGVLLLIIGVGGLMLPGPVGSPFLVFGGVILFPRAFRKVDRGMQERFPNAYREGMRQVKRFVGDLERAIRRTPDRNRSHAGKTNPTAAPGKSVLTGDLP